MSVAVIFTSKNVFHEKKTSEFWKNSKKWVVSGILPHHRIYNDVDTDSSTIKANEIENIYFRRMKQYKDLKVVDSTDV